MPVTKWSHFYNYFAKAECSFVGKMKPLPLTIHAIAPRPSPFTLLAVFLALLSPELLLAQDKSLSKQYVGFFPSLLLEPYDTVNALETNILPIIYEIRWGEKHTKAVQVRPIANYRFLKNRSGISHLGGTVLMNWYLISMVEDGFWLKPQLGSFYTYT